MNLDTLGLKLPVGPAIDPAAAFDSVEEIAEALRSPHLRSSDLYGCWGQRRPVQDPRARTKTDPAVQVGSRQINWLKKDLGLVLQFTQRALEKDEFLLVCDAAREAQYLWGESTDEEKLTLVRIRMNLARALLRLGSMDLARKKLEPFLEPGFRPALDPALQAEVLLLLGDIVREQSHESSSLAGRLQTVEEAQVLYERAVALAPHRLDALALAAAAALVTSSEGTPRREQAHVRARDVLRLATEVESQRGTQPGIFISRGIAHTVLGEVDEAAETFRKFSAPGVAPTALLAEVRYRLQFLAEALGRPRNFFNPAFPQLQLIVFSGHYPDRPGEPARWPLALVPEALQELRRGLAQLDARAAMLCAGAGADLLCFQALRERGATTHLVLPWAREEFLRTSVLPYEPAGGPALWQPLFRAALQEADTVREEGHLFEPSSQVGWEYLTEVIAGMALQTARVSRLDVQPMVLWDGQPDRRPGGPESFVRFWERLGETPVQLFPPRPEPYTIQAPVKPPSRKRAGALLEQSVKSMLFADIVGYSKLTEFVIPAFIQSFMERLSRLVSESAHSPHSVNTWGDAIYGVFDQPHDAGCFALELAQMVQEGRDEWLAKGLYWEERVPATEGTPERVTKHPLNIRIGLHTGPVFFAHDPVVRRLTFTGAHVSRAARIEPVAEHGQVFASEEFAALAELDRTLHDLQPGSLPLNPTFVCEYAGTMQLAKNYPGHHRIYRVLPKRLFAVEELAEAAHEDYCRKARARGETSESNAALRKWADLSEDAKNANRAQVSHIPTKLRLLGYELAPSHGLPPHEMVITDAQVEELAILEHDRWMRDRLRHGWTFAPVRDNARKQHHLLVPWEELDEKEKQKDRDTVRNLPDLIALAKFHVRKLPLGV